MSLYFSLFAGFVCAITVFISSINFLNALLALVISLPISYFFSMFFLEKYFFKHIEKINKDVLNSIKYERFSNHLATKPADSLIRLENSVKRLISEKTVEIYNLKELERMRKEFLGDVAHELRSPIFNIQGYIHTLIEGASKDNNVNEKFLNKAAKHVDHLSTLVEDLVTISRIEAGELRLEYINFDILEVINEVIDLHDHTAKAKNIKLQLNTKVEKPLWVNADRSKIKQVLTNLTSNSIKYGKPNGATIFKVTTMSNLASIQVADNGEGIAEEHLQRIFERFYRIDKSRSRNSASSGLGLAIVKHFIEAHHQKIVVTSRENVGSIFSFNLRLANDIRTHNPN